MKQVSMDTFHQAIRDSEISFNAGCTAEYNHKTDKTLWLVAGKCIGMSAGKLGTNSDYFLKMDE